MDQKSDCRKRTTDLIIQPNGKNVVYTYCRENLLTNEPDNNLIDKMSPNKDCRFIYRWENGRVGAIVPDASGLLLDFREYEMCEDSYDNLKSPKGLRPVKGEEDDADGCKELVATGIIAYYLNMRNKKNPKDIFRDYLEDRREEFFLLRDTEMRAWNPHYKNKFSYSEHIKEENRRIIFSSRIFDFLSVVEVEEIKDMMDNYLAFVKSHIPLYIKELTWEDEKESFKSAVLHVMERKKHDGEYLFNKPSLWMAVYRFAIDSSVMYELKDPKEPKDSSTPQYKIFDDFAHELHLDVNPPTRLPFTKNAINSINSNKSYVRYNTCYPWSKDGIKDPRSFLFYTEMEDVYGALMEDFNNLVRQKELLD